MTSSAVPAFSDIGASGWWIFRRPQTTKLEELAIPASERGDISGVYYNPSILGVIKQKEVELTSQSGLGNDSFSSVLFGMPLKGGGFSVSASCYDSGSETLDYMQNGDLVERNVTVERDLLGTVSYGRSVTDKLSLGVSVKYATSNIAELATASAFAGDIGAMYKIPSVKNLTVGAAVQNIGKTTQFLNNSDKLPETASVGAVYSYLIGAASSFGLGVNAKRLIPDAVTQTAAGVEYNYSCFNAQVGYKFGADDAGLQLVLGLTMLHSFDISYAYTPATYLSSANSFSLGYRF